MDAIRIWNHTGGVPVQTLTGSANSIERIAYSNDGGTIFSGDDSALLAWWRLSDGQQTNSVKAHASAISGIQVSPDGNFIVTCSMLKPELKIWRIADATLLQNISADSIRVDSWFGFFL